jgi:origin recognition complex subunit 1
MQALHEALTGEYLGPKNALEQLQQRFSTEPRGKAGLARRPLVVLVDELDLLVTRNQSLLYNIFDWPTLPHSRLIVIGKKKKKEKERPKSCHH